MSAYLSGKVTLAAVLADLEQQHRNGKISAEEKVAAQACAKECAKEAKEIWLTRKSADLQVAVAHCYLKTKDESGARVSSCGETEIRPREAADYVFARGVKGCSDCIAALVESIKSAYSAGDIHDNSNPVEVGPISKGDGRMVRVFDVSQGEEPDIVILTDCADEETFIRQLSLAMGVLGSPDVAVVEQILTRSADLCAKYRGYKSSVTEKRQLLAGTAWPTDDQESIATSLSKGHEPESVTVQ